MSGSVLDNPLILTHNARNSQKHISLDWPIRAWIALMRHGELPGTDSERGPVSTRPMTGIAPTLREAMVMLPAGQDRLRGP